MTHIWDKLTDWQREKQIQEINAITGKDYRPTLRVVPYHQLPSELKADIHTLIFELDEIEGTQA